MLVQGSINKREVHAYTVLVKNREEKNHFEACEQMWVLLMYLELVKWRVQKLGS
jgi:hypothetical protein